MLLATWGASRAAPARAEVTLSVAPSLVEMHAAGGGTGGQDLLVWNEGTDSFEVIAAVEAYKQASGDQSAVNWLQVTPERFHLAPGERQIVTVTVTVPDDVSDGGRYAAVTLRTSATPMDDGTTAVAGQVGVPFLLAVGAAEGLSRRAEVESLLPVLEADGRVGFRALVANRGNLHLASRGGEVAVSSAGGGPAERLELQRTTALLPGMEDWLAAEGTVALEPGAAYRAEAALEYGGGVPATAQATFRVGAGLSVLDVSAQERVGQGPVLRLKLRNDGDLGLLPRVQFGVRDAVGAMLGTSELLRLPPVPPHQSVDVEAPFPRRLPSGEYTVIGRVEYGPMAPVERANGFRIGTPAPPASPAWSDLAAAAPQPAPSAPAAHAWPIVAGLLAAALAASAWLARRRAAAPARQARPYAAAPAWQPRPRAAPPARQARPRAESPSWQAPPCAEPPSSHVLLAAAPGAPTAALVSRLERAGCAVARADAAAAAQDRLAGGLPDAVLLDASLPGLDRLRIYGALRADPRGRDLPILFLNHDAPAPDAPPDGPDAYLRPEATPADVARALRRLRARRAGRPAPLALAAGGRA